MVQITRRQWLVLSGLAVSGACGPKKGTGFLGYALVSNAGDHGLAVVDLTGFRLDRPIPLGAPASEAVTGRLGQTFALTPSTGTVHLIDTDLRVVKSRKFSATLSAMCLSPEGEMIMAIAPDARQLVIAKASSLDVVATHKLSAEPSAVHMPPLTNASDGAKPRYVAVSSRKQAMVELFDYGTGQRWRRDLAGILGAVRFRADAERLLVANLQDRCISALTTPALQTIADLPLAMKPENLCFNADQGQLFVSGEGMDAVAIIFPYNPLQVDQTILAGHDPGLMACSANPPYLFVGSHSGSDVCILNIDSRKMVGIVDAGERPTYITVTPDSQYALVLNEVTGTMAVIHIPAVVANASDAAKWRNKVTAGLFTLLPVGDRPVHALVVPRRA